MKKHAKYLFAFFIFLLANKYYFKEIFGMFAIFEIIIIDQTQSSESKRDLKIESQTLNNFVST